MAADPSTTPLPGGEFLLATCHGGAEEVLRDRLLALLPGARPGAWRRGVVTIRLPPATRVPDDPSAGRLAACAFARALVHCHGQVTGADAATLAAAVAALPVAASASHLHVWQRDPRPSRETADPPDAAVARAEAALVAAIPGLTPGTAPEGAPVVDVVIDDERRWWVGWHRAGSVPGRHPGGVIPVTAPADMVSRAWLKLDEALTAFAVDLEPGQRAVELGAAPGGASQRLLAAGLGVVGIDPALVDPRVAGHPGFTHWRKRARDVRLRELVGFDWIVTDMNIDPTSTLEALGRIATARGVRARGIIATLKLPEWGRAAGLDGWLATIRGWGYAPRVRQLASGGREVCVVALRRPRRRATRPAGE